MKRLISLLLAIVLVVGLMPTAFADGAATPDVALTLGTPTPKTVTVSGESVTYYEIPVKVKNNTSEKITLNAFECYLKFDATGFTPVELMADDKTLIMSASFGSAVSNWSSKTTEKKNDLVLATGAEGKLEVVFLNVPANGETELFKLNLKPVDGIEKGDYLVRFATREEAAAFQAKASGNQVAYDGGAAGKTVYAASENKLDCSATTTISITDGAAPTLESISVTPTDSNPGNAVYGTARTYTLKAFSTSKKDITSLVEFRDTHTGAELKYTDASTLSTSDHTPAGTYKISAVAKKAADGTALCTVPENEYTKGTFTVDKQTLTSAAVIITGFGKGLTVDNVGAEDTNNSGFNTYVTVDTTDTNLKANTEYTINLELRPIPELGYGETTYRPNYQFANNTTLTVSGLGADITPDNITVADNGYLTATVTARTGAKDQLEVTEIPKVGSAKFGQQLKEITLTGGAVTVKGDPSKPVTGGFEWAEPDTVLRTVGKAERIEFRFVPDNADLYEIYTGYIDINNIGKAEINLVGVDSWWTESNLKYTGSEQTVTLELPEGIKDLVKIEYSTDLINEASGKNYTNKATNVGAYTAKAVLTPQSPSFYKFVGYSGGDDAMREVARVWYIDKADFTPANVSENVSYSTTEVTIPRSELTGDVSRSDITIVLPTSYPEDALIQNAEETENGDIKLTLKATGIEDAKKELSGSITLTYTSDNYETGSKSSTITIKIVEKTKATVTVDNAPANITYGDSAKLTSRWNGEGDAVITASMTGNSTGAVTYASGTLTATRVGTVFVTLKYESATHIGEVTVGITVEKRPITVKALDTSIAYGDAIPTAFELDLTEGTLATGDTLAGLGITASTEATDDSPVGTYSITLDLTNANKNYTCTAAEPNGNLSITAKQLAADDITVSTIEPVTYNGQKHTPTPTVSYGGTTLTNEQYELTYGENTNAGTGTVTVNLKGNYTGTKNVEFTINPKSLTGADIADIAAVTYNGSEHKPEPVVKLDGTTLEKGKDYTVTYANNVNASTETSKATVTVTGKGNYTGTAEKNFTINKKVISKPNDINIDVRYTDTELKNVSISDRLVDINAITKVTYRADNGEPDSCFQKYGASTDAQPEFTFVYQLSADEAVADYTNQIFVFTVILDYNENYDDLAAQFKINIRITDKDPQAALTYTGATTMTYNQSIPLSYTGGSGSGEVSYTVTNDTGAATVSGSTLTATKAGTVYLTVHKGGDNTYFAKSSEPVTITINKATPTAPAEIKVDNTDTTLGELGREMVKKIGVSGTIKWYDSDNKQITDPDNTKIEANKEYSWTFVPNPNDEISTNYNEIHGKTTPYVRDDLSWLPGVINGGSNFTFHDVNRFDYYYDSVKWAADNGIASGTSRFAFSPDAVCTRAQTVTFLWRAAGSPLPRYRACPFTDVHANDYYYEAVLWAVEQGITTGLTATTFGPDETVTRGQVATFLYRAASAAKPNTFNPFMDVKPTAYNYDAILWAYDNRITTGTSTTTFSPDAFCTRAQIVTFLYRYYQGR